MEAVIGNSDPYPFTRPKGWTAVVEKPGGDGGTVGIQCVLNGRTFENRSADDSLKLLTTPPAFGRLPSYAGRGVNWLRNPGFPS